MHIVPLAYLTLENSSRDQISFNYLAAFGLLLSLAHITLAAVETSIMHISQVYQRNLEQRVFLRSETRLQELSRVALLGTIITGISLTIGLYVFPS